MHESEKVKVKSLSRIRPSATPWTAAYQAPPSMGFSRQEYWSGVPLPSPLQVCGYHLRLHLGGYLSCYDLWTNVGFPDIHRVGWCEKTKHDLYIPQGK